ncbi:MAG TPA: 30S ribosome-binding factor RbfA [Candidatus Limnocylindrales bacterium]|jgi:ribosome-binding factor A|nr:30S ribosome-binding factor RbfA [Candidatus Limnocylindrales bacterium]
MTARTTRIDELLRQEMGSILARDVEDPRIGFATIISIETTPDLRHAKVLVSVIGQPGDRKTTLNALGRAMPFVRHELGKRLRIKRIPEFHLELDDSVERGTRVMHLLDEIGAGRAPDEDQPEGETLPTPSTMPSSEPSLTEGLGGAAADLASAEARESAARDRLQPRRTFRPSSRAHRAVPGKRRR